MKTLAVFGSVARDYLLWLANYAGCYAILAQIVKTRSSFAGAVLANDYEYQRISALMERKASHEYE